MVKLAFQDTGAIPRQKIFALGSFLASWDPTWALAGGGQGGPHPAVRSGGLLGHQVQKNDLSYGK